MVYIKLSCILSAVTDFIYNNKENQMQFFGDAICYCELSGQDLLYICNYSLLNYWWEQAGKNMKTTIITLRTRQNGCHFGDIIFKLISLYENCILFQMCLKLVWKDRLADRQGDTSIPPFQLRWSWGYN